MGQSTEDGQLDVFQMRRRGFQVELGKPRLILSRDETWNLPPCGERQFYARKGSRPLLCLEEGVPRRRRMYRPLHRVRRGTSQ
jgi:hypothetical protein